MRDDGGLTGEIVCERTRLEANIPLCNRDAGGRDRHVSAHMIRVHVRIDHVEDRSVRELSDRR